METIEPTPTAPPPETPRPSEAATAAPITVADLDSLVKNFTEIRTVYFTPSGEMVFPAEDDKKTPVKYARKGAIAVKIRALSDDELAEADDLIAFYPPRKKKDPTLPRTGIQEEDELDALDPDYQKKMREARRKRRATVILTGLVEPEITGKNFEDKEAFLRSKLPSRFLDMLQREIERISGGMLQALELANFT